MLTVRRAVPDTDPPGGARVIAFAIVGTTAGGIGPLLWDAWVQIHGIRGSQVDYTLVPPVGGMSGVTPDPCPLPEGMEPMLLPLGSSIILNNRGAGTRGFTAVFWPA